MQQLPHHHLESRLSLKEDHSIDNKTARETKRKLANQFREQLTFGAPSNDDEQALQRLVRQLKEGKVKFKLFLRHQLHAKLYLCHRSDSANPIIGFVGSSNLTFAGLSGQGELNVDVLDSDATCKLSRWFEDRWNDQYCVDITNELVEIIEESWARTTLVPPYHIYLKMAYHLSREARKGISYFKIPGTIEDRLFDFQIAAVKIAARHLNTRGGVLIGDVVGLGKTLMATTIARLFEDSYDIRTLILCPKNLKKMWDDYREQYGLRAKVMSFGQVLAELENQRRYGLVIIDESHNLRNRDRKRYRVIREYIKNNDSKCILLSATPYNKEYSDLSSQLRLFLNDDHDVGIRPEKLLRTMGELEFMAKHPVSTRSIAAFEQSQHVDDWRDLMSLYMVRRTRSFIEANYASTDPTTGKKFLQFGDGTRQFFPTRKPSTVKFKINENDPNDQYAKLYAEKIVDAIGVLSLPRYGLGNYLSNSHELSPTETEGEIIRNLSRAGSRLRGFCRTNLFKRLESSGEAFILSIKRHILRNYIYLHALRNNLDLPIGTHDITSLDSEFTDEDLYLSDESDADAASEPDIEDEQSSQTKSNLRDNAAKIYSEYVKSYKNRFKWLHPKFFVSELEADLQADADCLLEILKEYGNWDPGHDEKLNKLYRYLTSKHRKDKVLIFSQFADTVRYLKTQLERMGVKNISSVTGSTQDPSEIAWKFSPRSSARPHLPENELRVLITTDLLSEGQNLQDCFVVINYDLPWAIIRLIQRAGRVDRIGQKSGIIHCYTFLPADGIEKIINLRGRLIERLKENEEVVGTDDRFFKEAASKQKAFNLYNEHAGILNDDDDDEVDLTSHAYQIWKNATQNNPKLAKTVSSLPNSIFSSRGHALANDRPEGALVFVRTSDESDRFAYVDINGNIITESQLEILAAAECKPETRALPHPEYYHDLVADSVKRLVQNEKKIGGQLGKPSSAKFKTYTRLKAYVQNNKQYSGAKELERTIDEIFRYPLRQSAIDQLNLQIRGGADDDKLAEIVIKLSNEDRLCLKTDLAETTEPKIICSMGLVSETVS